MMKKGGFRDWTIKNINILKGCSHGCLYCYANSINKRYQQRKDVWTEEEISKRTYGHNYRKRGYTLGYPSTHDITPKWLDYHLTTIKSILTPGNNLLIVSKPHLECIKAICEECSQWKKQILFRFSIGSSDDKILKVWEPNAPSYQERLSCLEYAFRQGYATSVSCEPMLDNRIGLVVKDCLPLVTDTIWLGMMNKYKSRLKSNGYPEMIELATKLVNSIDLDEISELKESSRKIEYKTELEKLMKGRKKMTTKKKNTPQEDSLPSPKKLDEFADWKEKVQAIKKEFLLERIDGEQSVKTFFKRYEGTDLESGLNLITFQDIYEFMYANDPTIEQKEKEGEQQEKQEEKKTKKTVPINEVRKVLTNNYQTLGQLREKLGISNEATQSLSNNLGNLKKKGEVVKGEKGEGWKKA